MLRAAGARQSLPTTMTIPVIPILPTGRTTLRNIPTHTTPTKTMAMLPTAAALTTPRPCRAHGSMTTAATMSRRRKRNRNTLLPAPNTQVRAVRWSRRREDISRRCRRAMSRTMQSPRSRRICPTIRVPTAMMQTRRAIPPKAAAPYTLPIPTTVTK